MKKLTLLVVIVVVSLIFQSTAMAYKTFKCTGGVFNKDKEDNGGECVIYVRYEIGDGNIQKYYNVCNGEAWTCYQDAINAGYAVGQTPRVGAIVVFAKSGMYSSAGHVGLVKSTSGTNFVVRESNVDGVHIIGERTISNDDPNILGYIYCAPTQIPYVGVTEGNTSIYWTPTDVSCINATGWRYNGMSTMYPGTICSDAYNELKDVNFFKYNLDDWFYTFFGNQSQYNSTQYCGSD